MRTRLTAYIVVVAVAAGIAGAVGASPLAQSVSGLSEKEIAQAIEWGASGDPQPYILRANLGSTSPPPSGAAGAIAGIYTPFLRVALATKAAWADHRDFTPADVTKDMAAPVVYVAFRWYCCDHERPDPATFNPFRPFDYKIAQVQAVGGASSAAPRRLPNERELRTAAPPLWIRRDVSSLLKSFGGELPYDDVVLVAGYPMEILTADRLFVIYREFPPAFFPDPPAIRMELRAGWIFPRGPRPLALNAAAA